jgi:hypothetical protein
MQPRKIWSPIPRDHKQRITVVAKARNKLPAHNRREFTKQKNMVTGTDHAQNQGQQKFTNPEEI